MSAASYAPAGKQSPPPAPDLSSGALYSRWIESHRAIFIHVPKTAGHSIAAALAGNLRLPGYHVPYFVYQRANPEKFRDYFKFAFVRNPWDRLVSAYAYMSRDDNRPAYEHILSSDADFESFVHRLAELELGPRQDLNPLIPQSHFLLNEDGRLMVDFLGRYEDLHSGLESIARKLGVGSDVELSRLNAGAHANYRSLYTAETVRIVERIYATDIAAFGYRF